MILASIYGPGAALPAHGVTGTWLDEILELGIPLVLFAFLWWWSTRKEKRKARAAKAAAAEGATATVKADRPK